MGGPGDNEYENEEKVIKKVGELKTTLRTTSNKKNSSRTSRSLF
jgi:hypothetical protein